MQNLWAPWRIEYIKKVDEDGCFLCDLVSKEENAESLIVKRNELCMCVMNRYPYSNGHLMVAPNEHLADLGDLSDELLLAMMRMTQESQKMLRQTIAPHGFNVGINLGRPAGAGLDAHIHIHIVPRWSGDTNFMAVMDDCRVIPQALEELYNMLREVK